MAIFANLPEVTRLAINRMVAITEKEKKLFHKAFNAMGDIWKAGTETGFHSIGIDDNATSVALTLDSSQNSILSGDLVISTDGKVIELGHATDTTLSRVSAGVVAIEGTNILQADGSIALTSNWDVGAYTLTGTQFISDITTGTAPFVVASTTVVTNLKADTVVTNANLTGHITSIGNVAILGTFTKAQLSTAISDGTPFYNADTSLELGHATDTTLTRASAGVLAVEGTNLLQADGSIPLTANWDVGAFTITGTRFISDIVTGTSPLVVASTTVVTNLKADTVVTNANLTGHITSTGNAAVLGSFTIAQLNTAVSDSTLVTVAGAYHDGFSDFVANEHIAHNYGSMYDKDNTDVFVITDPGGDFHSYHTNGLTIGPEVLNWTFDAGGGGTSFPIASIADGAASGTDIAVTTTGNHLLAVDDIISQTNLTAVAYVGIFKVKAIINATTYEVAAVYTATDTGTMDQAATIIAGASAGGIYSICWSASATSETNNETFDYKMYINAVAIPGSGVRRKFGTATDYGAWGECVPQLAIVTGDKISLAISNQDTAGNLTMRHLTIVLVTT